MSPETETWCRHLHWRYENINGIVTETCLDCGRTWTAPYRDEAVGMKFPGTRETPEP